MDSVIATVIWKIWKGRCGLIFQDQQIDPHWIALSAVEEVKKYISEAIYKRESFFLNIFNTYPSYYIFTDAAWVLDEQMGGCGLCIINSNKVFIIAGCSGMHAEMTLEAELTAIQIGLRVAIEWALNIEVTFTDCIEAKRALEKSTNHCNDKINEIVSSIKRLIYQPDQHER